MRNRILPIALLSVIAFSASEAAVSQSAVLFLRIASGARAAGMGEAFVAIADDATATHWNPAGLGNYPLSSVHNTFAWPSDSAPQMIGLSSNGRPERNYRRYDVWAAQGGRLWRFDGERWTEGGRERTAGATGLTEFLRALTGVSDEGRLASMRRSLAAANNAIERSRVEALVDRVVSALPAEYSSPETFRASADALLAAWDDLKVDGEAFATLEALVSSSLADGALTTLEADKISFALDRAASGTPPDEVVVPYSELFPAKVTAIATDRDGDLLVGTEAGLWRRTSDRWIELTDESFPSRRVLCVATNERGTIAVGTDAGLSVSVRGSWQHLFLNDDSTHAAAVSAVAVSSDDKAWAFTNEGLTRFDGKLWADAYEVAVKPGDSRDKLLERFSLDGSPSESAAWSFDLYNRGVEVRQGARVWVPLSGAVVSPATALAVDGKNRLWIGTERGVLSLDEDGVARYGYDVHTVTPGETIAGIVAKYVPAGDSRAEWLRARVLSDNGLAEGQEPAVGSALAVYIGPAASKVNALASSGGEVLVATERGLLVYDGKEWKRYEGADLGKGEVTALVLRDGERWLAGPDGLVVYAHAKTEFTFMHVKWLPALAEDLAYEFFSAVHSFSGWGTFGLNVTFLNLGTNTRTDENGNVLGEFSSYEMAAALSYGTRVNQDLSLGLSGKFIYSRLADFGQGRETGTGDGSSFAVDLGALYRVPFMRRLSVGVAITNIGPNIAYIDVDQADPLPRNLGVGVAYRLVDSPYNRLTLQYEGNKELVGMGDDMSTELTEVVSSMGAEYWYGTFLALRAGYLYDRVGERRHATFGASLSYSDYRFDFSYIPPGRDNTLENTTRLSLTARF